MTTTSISRRRVLALATGATGILAAPAVRAQAFPAKPIRLIVPFAPGGTSSVVARSVADELTRQLGQSVVIDNKGGGGGVSAMAEAKAAAPDGYTLIITHVGTLAVNPYMLKNQPYDVARDFTPITLLAKVPNIFVIHPDVPAKDFKEFVAHVKKNPGRLNYGSAGNASAGHLAMEYLKMVTGMFITHIPYRGTGPQLTDLLAGRTQASSAGTPALLPHIKAGKLRALAVTSPQRNPQLLQVPTMAEAGLRDVEISAWYGIYMPASTPKAVQQKVHDEVNKVISMPETKTRLEAVGAELRPMPQADFGSFHLAEYKRFGDIIRKNNIKLD